MADKATPKLIPDFLQLKQTSSQGRGLFAKKAFRCGEEILRCKPYALGVCSRNKEGLHEACHNCAKQISKGSATICEKCGVAAYCGDPCFADARRVHLAECQGLRELEAQRPLKSRYKPFSDSPYDDYWPPSLCILTARALNRKIMDEKSIDEWEISFLSEEEKLKPSVMKKPLELMRPLVLQSVTSDEMICDTFCRVSAGSFDIVSINSSIKAVYIEVTLLNHSCVPNCRHEDDNGMKIVRLLCDVKAGEQLCISYIRDIYRLLPGDFRRHKIEEFYSFRCKCISCLCEQEVSSDMWKLDQQKKKVANACPSPEAAERAMAEGFRMLKDLVPAQESRKWARVADLAEHAVKKYKDVLDEKNIFQYIFSRVLIEAFLHLEQPKKAIEMFRVVKKSMRDYELQRDVQQINIQAALCYIKLGRKEEGWKILRSISNFRDLMFSMMEEGKVDMTSLVTLL